MKPMTALTFVFATASFLFAQEKPQAPNPKTKAHEVLATLAGDWQSNGKMPAMPGVPGMEKAQESTGTEHTELICNGLWVKSAIDGSYAGKPFLGIWLVGYDPFAKKYICVMTSSQDEPDCTADGSYDEKTRTWTFQGKSAQGPFRSTWVFKDNDHSVETCFMTTADGKEVQCMELTRTRTKGAAAKEASTAVGKPPSAEHAPLLTYTGTWDAAVKMAMEGQPAGEEKCTEVVTALCDGRWTWSNFTGQMMGAPFDGHALTGYDSAQKKYVSYWIDSMGPTWMRTTGTIDAATKTFTMDGPCLDDEGKPGTVHQVGTQPDKDTRKLDMTFKTQHGTMQMTIQYKRTKG